MDHLQREVVSFAIGFAIVICAGVFAMIYFVHFVATWDSPHDPFAIGLFFIALLYFLFAPVSIVDATDFKKWTFTKWGSSVWSAMLWYRFVKRYPEIAKEYHGDLFVKYLEKEGIDYDKKKRRRGSI